MYDINDKEMTLDEAIKLIGNLPPDEMIHNSIKYSQIYRWLKELSELHEIVKKYSNNITDDNEYFDEDNDYDENQYWSEDHDWDEDHDWGEDEEYDESELDDKIISAMDEALVLIKSKDLDYKNRFVLERVSSGKENTSHKDVTIQEYIDKYSPFSDHLIVSEKNKSIPMSQVEMYYRAYDVMNKYERNDYGELLFVGNMTYTAFIDKDTKELLAVKWNED